MQNFKIRLTTKKIRTKSDIMSENNTNWLNIGIGAFIILAIALLLVLVLPLSNLAIQQDQIAAISISGTVTYDSSNSTKIFTSASQIEKALDDANSNKNVKAIVLDINSKGGSEVASEEIAEKIKKSSKPVIAYIGDKIAHVHIKDGKRSENPLKHDLDYTVLGEGEIPIKEIITTLVANGYTGYFSLEWESLWRNEIQDCFDNVGDVLKMYRDYLEKIL